MAILFDREAGIEDALRQQGITNDAFINSIMGAINKESKGKNRAENLNYSGSSAKRLKGLFSKLRNLSDEEVDKLKKNPEQFANVIYGDRLGNKEAGDGWKFRGRGPLQITGRNNYAKASQEIFGDDRLVKNPDLILENDDVANQTTAWFVKHNLGNKLNQNVSQEQANLLVAKAVNPNMPLLEKVAKGATLYSGRERFKGLDPTVSDPYALPTPPPKDAKALPNRYTVQAGDTLGRIAQQYDMSVNDIAALNNIADPNKIAVGQQLEVPRRDYYEMFANFANDLITNPLMRR